MVMEAVRNSVEDPFTRWSDLAQKLPGRVGKQVRDRWVNHLNPAINHLPFNREDVSFVSFDLSLSFHFMLPSILSGTLSDTNASHLLRDLCRTSCWEGHAALGKR